MYFEEQEKKSDSVLIIPVLNEGKRIVNQIAEINLMKDREFDVIIVDGNSNDGSIQIISSEYKNVIKNILTAPESKGLSHQLRIGFNYCLKSDYKFFVTMDGNNKDGVEGINLILDKLKEGFDFIQGSRFLSLNGAINNPLHRVLAIKFIHAPIVSFFSGKKFTDTTNGFRGFSRNLLECKEVDIFRDVFCKYELITYIPIRAGQLGLSICEVPVVRRYPADSTIPTKINGIKAHLILIKTLLLSAIGYYNPNSFSFTKIISKLNH
jgi:dolichol-phosphate mannosyltransferase